MKTLTLFVAMVSLFLGGCASSDSMGKIGSDYEMNRTYQSGQVQQMHSSIQRGTY
jgi:outer membrane lipoprotein SlyB